ncbi:MAG: peptidase [Daejeonella sp.]|nr:peptidase [Daejeonella sp.]
MEQYITGTPVASIIFIFTIVSSLYAFSNPEVFGKLMLHPYSVSRGRRIYSVITSGLIHKDWGHLIMNMLSYFFFAFKLEATFVQFNPKWGHIQFAFLYIISLILSDISSIIKHKEDSWYNSLGASGAVCAVVFSSILFNPMATMYVMPIPFPINSVIYGFLFLAYCMYAARIARDNINHDAHFYGALTGVLVTVLYYPGILSFFFNQISGRLS